MSKKSAILPRPKLQAIDNDYETPADEPPFVAPYEIPINATYETPINEISIKSSISNGFNGSMKGRSTLQSISINQAISHTVSRPVLPSCSRVESPDSNENYYDQKPLDRPVVTVWWRGRLRLEINFYFAIIFIIFITLVAFISTITWICLLVTQTHDGRHILQFLKSRSFCANVCY